MEDESKKILTVDELNEKLPDFHSTTTLFSGLFLPSTTIPKKLLQDIASDTVSLEKQLLAEKPLFTAKITKPYWKKGSNLRGYDEVDINIYSSVCLVSDRSVLEAIISATGDLFDDLSRLTLRQAFEVSPVNVSYDYLSLQDYNRLDSAIFSGDYDYYLVSFSRLFKFLNMTNTKKNRQTILSRIKRLSTMDIELKYSLKGEPAPKFDYKMSLVDRTYITFLVKDAIRNKKAITEDTRTHMILGVDRRYSLSLMQDGAISRERFVNSYYKLNGNYAFTDFAKYLDSHKREFLNGKVLKEMIEVYYSEKFYLPNVKYADMIKNTLGECLIKRELLETEFNLTIKSEYGQKGEVKHRLIYKSPNQQMNLV